MGTWFQKTFEECGNIRKLKFFCELFDYLHVHGPSFHHWRHDKKIKCKCSNEMLIVYCTALGSISKNKEYNLE